MAEVVGPTSRSRTSGATLTGSAKRNALEIPSQTRSVFADRPRRVPTLLVTSAPAVPLHL